MRCIFRLTSALASVCLLAALSAESRPAFSQNVPQSQVHPITGLPLPPDETSGQPAPAVTAPATKAPATAKPAKSTKSTKAGTKPKPEPKLKPEPKSAPTPEPLPAAPAPAPVAPAPVVEKPAPTLEAPAPAKVVPAPRTRKGRPEPKPAPLPEAAPATSATEPKVHPILLPPPPDEAPAPSPAPAAVAPAPAPKPVPPTPASKPVAPAPVAPAPVPTPKAKPAKPEPKQPKLKPRTATPAPATETPAPAVVPAPASAPKPNEVVPSPKPVEPKPAPPAAPAPQPAVITPTPVEPPPAPKPAPPAPAVISEPAPAPAVTKPASTPAVVAKPEPAPVAPLETPAPAPAVAPVVSEPAPKAKPHGSKSKPVPVTMPAAPVETPVAPPTPAPVVTKPSIVVPPSESGIISAPASKPTPVAAAPAASAPPPPPGTLGSIIFQGAAPFTQSELATLSGLTLGTKPSQENLQSATDNLIHTGLFVNVSASYDTPNNVGTATFALTPMPPSQLARPSFANIIWLTPAEIDAALKNIPLFHGYIPISDGLHLADQIQGAIEGQLAARHIQAVITHMLVAPTQAHPYSAVEFRVTAPSIVLAQAQVFDVPPALVNKTLAAEAAAVKYPYNEGDSGTTLSDLLLAPTREAGYIGARLWHIERKRRVSGNTIYVDYSARLEAGPVYAVRSVNWTPNAVLSEAQFKKIAALRIGQPPSATEQQRTEQGILSAYNAQGYLEATVSSTQTLDARSGAASYTFTATPGPQYTLRSIQIEGLDPAARKDFESAWTMRPGDFYNEPYLLNFLANHPEITSLKPYTFTYNRSATTDTHQVDLTLSFKHN